MPVVFLTSASTSPWSQPGDWVDAGHTVRLIGAGGRGGTSLAGTTYRGGPGGGGGAHVLLTRTSGSLSSTTAFLVSADNSSITDRTTGATCWGSATFANCRYAEAGEGGGVGGTDFNGGLGGDATTTSVGTPTGPTYSASLNNSGGAGGTLTSPTVSGGGGGGAGGPSGVGGDGGATTTTTRGGSGGGAGNGGGSAAATSGVNGTAGAGAGGGAGGTTSTAAGDATGSAGSGGGGGFFSAVAAADTHGGAGGVSALYTQSSDSATGGPGGGGGGGGSNSSTTSGPITSGGNGGNYGAGGGGAAGARSTTSTRNPGAGASGLIAISYSSPSGVAFGSGGTYLTYASHTNATLSPPAGIVDGDLLLAYVATGASGSSPTVTAPGGWTALTGSPTNISSDGGFNVKFYIFYKFASSESGSYTFTHSTSGSCGLVARYTGVDSSTPFSPTPTTNTGGADVATATGFTTTVADTFVIFAEHDWSDNSIDTVVPTGTTPVFTERADDALIYIADGKLASPGATGNKSHTCNNTTSGTNSKWGAYLIGLKPASGGSTDTITVAAATVTLTGKTVTIRETETVPVAKATATLVGQTVTVRDTSVIPVLKASVLFTGKTVTVRDLELIPVLKASVVCTGKTVTIFDTTGEAPITVNKADVSFVGQAITVRDAEVIPVLKATVLFAGQTVTVRNVDIVPVAQATVLFTGKSVTIVDLVGTQVIQVGKGDILFTGQNVAISTTGEQLPGGGGGVTVPPWRDLGRKKRRRYRALEEIEKRLDQRIERLESEAQEAQEQVAEVRLQFSTAQIAVVPDHYGDLLRRKAQITQMLHEAQRRAETVRQERIELAKLARIASEEADDEEAIAMLMRFL